MYHRQREAIEAHLTIVFTALAVAHTIETRTGVSIAKVVKQYGRCAAPPSASTAPPRPSRRQYASPS